MEMSFLIDGKWVLGLVIALGLVSGVMAEDAVVKKAEGEKEWVLFDGKTLKGWKVHDIGGSGMVEVKDGELRVGQGESLSGVIYEKVGELPVTNYEISLEAKRLDGLDFFVGLTFPVGDLKTCVSLIMGGWTGSVTGISSIDGMDAAENSTGHYRRYEDNRWYAVRVQVTPESLKVFCDGESIIDVDIKGRKVGVRYGPMEEYVPFSLTTYQTHGAYRNIRVKPLSVKAAVKTKSAE